MNQNGYCPKRLTLAQILTLRRHVQKQSPVVFCKKRCSKMLNSQKNTYARVSFLIKLQASDLQLYFKTDSGTGIFL